MPKCTVAPPGDAVAQQARGHIPGVTGQWWTQWRGGAAIGMEVVVGFGAAISGCGYIRRSPTLQLTVRYGFLAIRVPPAGALSPLLNPVPNFLHRGVA